MTTLTSLPAPAQPTFLGVPFCADLDRLEADVAFIGIPAGTAYDGMSLSREQSNAPAVLRQVSSRLASGFDRYDFDLGGPLLDGKDIRLVDAGNVVPDIGDITGHIARAESAVRKILAAGAMPIIFGGDHSIPLPVLRAFSDEAPLTIIQIDAHLDWRDELMGVRDGYSSTMRRASEMSHVAGMFQIGIRGPGSARLEEVQAAQAFGSRIVPATEIYEHGILAVLDEIPLGGNFYITIDADAFDPGVMPAVEFPAPGGLTFEQVRTLIHGLTKRGRVVGMDMVEIKPSVDTNHISSITAIRLIMNLIGAAVRSGRFDRR